jgi:Secretion system C-terminal sorting domain
MKKIIISIWIAIFAISLSTAQSVSYQYDELQRLKVALYPNYKITYTYDPVGNLIGRKRERTVSLPVHLLTFTALAENCETATLNWATATEQNTDRCIVEISDNGTNFKVLTSVKAVGNSSTIQQYTANAPILGKNTYFRLQILDFDGSIETSKTITINSSCANDGITLFPNPTLDKTTVYAEKPLQKIEIFDAVGRSLFTITPTSNATLIDLATQPAGMYEVRATDDKGVAKTFKVVKN